MEQQTRDQPTVKTDIRDGDGRFVGWLTFRPGTADESTIRHVFMKRQYGVDQLRRANDMREIHADILKRNRVPLILDLGANIGASALFFAHVWPRSKLVAVEPEAKNFGLLESNLAAVPNKLLINAAMSASGEPVRIIDNSAATDAYRTAAIGEGAEVQGMTMTTLLSQTSAVDEPFIVKIDVEGAEADIFSGDTAWIDLFPLIVIELHDWMLPRQAASHSFLKAISQYRRDFVVIGDTAFSIRC